MNVLADRLAAALVHHEPGWRLPRHSALARRYNVSVAEIDAAVGELVSRHLTSGTLSGSWTHALEDWEGLPVPRMMTRSARRDYPLRACVDVH